MLSYNKNHYYIVMIFYSFIIIWLSIINSKISERKLIIGLLNNIKIIVHFYIEEDNINIICVS